MQQHLAELLLESKLHGKPDRLRTTRRFSDDLAAVQSLLFNPDVPKLKKLAAYRRWLMDGQPCVFGRVAAKNENVFICLLEEQDILRMRNGDPDVRDTIQDARQCWKRLALDGRHSSFLILLLSPSLVTREPNNALKEICRKLMELYMEIPRVEDDTIHTQREYVFLRNRPGEPDTLVRFSTLPNVFCAQGDGRWWHDHRTPGGVMITSNALGHFVMSRSAARTISPRDRTQAIEHAMMTISNAFAPAKKNSGLKHCPATRLHLRPAAEATPLAPTSKMGGYSANSYSGFFHTDHLIPSVFFHPDRDPSKLSEYKELDLRYIHDALADPQSHAELMLGERASAYDLRQNLNRLPDFVNPETTGELSDKLRGKLANWADQRLRGRLG